MAEISTSATNKDITHAPSSSTSSVASTSAENASSSTNSNLSSTLQGNEQSKRKLTTDDKECGISQNKLFKCKDSEFDSLVSDFNKNIKNKSERKRIFHKIAKFTDLYKLVESYLINEYSTVTLIEEAGSMTEYNICNICKTSKYETKLRLLAKHILIDHQKEWPKDVKLDTKSHIAKVINNETSEADIGGQTAEKLNNRVQNTHEIWTSSETEASTFIRELEKCCNILCPNLSVTKEMLNSLKGSIGKLKSNADFMDNLMWDAKNSSFSIILNEHLSANEKIFLSLTITYFSNQKLCSLFYRLIEVKSEEFLRDMINQMQKDGLINDRFVGFAFELTKFKDSIIKSTLLNLENTIKDYLVQRTRPVIVNKHMHEPIRAIIEDRHKYISRDAEILLKETYNCFKSHNVQGLDFANDLLKTASTENIDDDIWILKLDLIFTVVTNWTGLKEYFEKINNSYYRWIIYDLYKNDFNQMYLKLIHRSLSPFKIFFEILNSSLIITKEQWTKQLQIVSNKLTALKTVLDASEKPTHYQNKKNNFLHSLERAIDKFLKSNDSGTPITILISNKNIKEIVSYINESINNFKDDFSAETLDLLETCIQIKFMKVNE